MGRAQAKPIIHPSTPPHDGFRKGDYALLDTEPPRVRKLARQASAPLFEYDNVAAPQFFIKKNIGESDCGAAFKCIEIVRCRRRWPRRRFLNYRSLDPMRIVLGRGPLKDYRTEFPTIKAHGSERASDPKAHFDDRQWRNPDSRSGGHRPKSQRAIGRNFDKPGSIASIIDGFATRYGCRSGDERHIGRSACMSRGIPKEDEVDTTRKFDVLHVKETFVLHLEEVR
jgi:hypothetical protein